MRPGLMTLVLAVAAAACGWNREDLGGHADDGAADADAPADPSNADDWGEETDPAPGDPAGEPGDADDATTSDGNAATDDDVVPADCAGDCVTSCEKAGLDCAASAYWPACCVIEGQPACCGCAIDADCQARFPGTGCACTESFTCIDPAEPTCDCGMSCDGCQVTAPCQEDGDCAPGGSAGDQPRKCTGANGYCFDPKGWCDGYTACCAAGHACFSVVDMFPGIPQIPGGVPGTGFQGACTCDTGADCLGAMPCTTTADYCDLPVIGDIFCPGGSPPASWPEKLCLDLGSLAELLGGT